MLTKEYVRVFYLAGEMTAAERLAKSSTGCCVSPLDRALCQRVNERSLPTVHPTLSLPFSSYHLIALVRLFFVGPWSFTFVFLKTQNYDRTFSLVA